MGPVGVASKRVEWSNSEETVRSFPLSKPQGQSYYFYLFFNFFLLLARLFIWFKLMGCWEMSSNPDNLLVFFLESSEIPQKHCCQSRLSVLYMYIYVDLMYINLYDNVYINLTCDKFVYEPTNIHSPKNTLKNYI